MAPVFFKRRTALIHPPSRRSAYRGRQVMAELVA